MNVLCILKHGGFNKSFVDLQGEFSLQPLSAWLCSPHWNYSAALEVESRAQDDSRKTQGNGTEYFAVARFSRCSITERGVLIIGNAIFQQRLNYAVDTNRDVLLSLLATGCAAITANRSPCTRPRLPSGILCQFITAANG